MTNAVFELYFATTICAQSKVILYNSSVYTLSFSNAYNYLAFKHHCILDFETDFYAPALIV